LRTRKRTGGNQSGIIEKSAAGGVKLAGLNPVLHGTGKELACIPVGLSPELELGSGVRLKPVAEYHQWGLHVRSAVEPGRMPAVIIHIPAHR
jgi:hypothetical protein